jgi:ferritin-like metal-binding protein YciE
MTIRTPQELFVAMLSDVRQREERVSEILEAFGTAAKDADVKEALESRAFIRQQNIAAIDRCFEVIGEKPGKPSGKLHEVFAEDFKRELAAIETPAVRRLFVLAKLKHLAHLHIGEYIALTTMADITKHHGVGVLLEACLAENLALVERTQRLVRRLVAQELGERLAA